MQVLLKNFKIYLGHIPQTPLRKDFNEFLMANSRLAKIGNYQEL